MLLGSLFQKVKSISPDEVRGIIKQRSTDEYSLLDVRQPAEYEQGHLPGAKLIPLGELQSNIGRVPTDKMTIVYCRSGNRSRSGVGILNGAGLDNVYNMERGILGYRGIVAAGPPEAGVFCFPNDMGPDQLVAMAWYVEDGSQRYFKAVGETTADAEVQAVFKSLIDLKSSHKASLAQLHAKISGHAAGDDFPGEVLSKPPHDVMAGCVSVPDAVAWSQDKQIADIMDVLMALEANTFDLYLKMGRQVASEAAASVFMDLSEEERRHLAKLAAFFEKSL